jgi:hypothetical protein
VGQRHMSDGGEVNLVVQGSITGTATAAPPPRVPPRSGECRRRLRPAIKGFRNSVAALSATECRRRKFRRFQISFLLRDRASSAADAATEPNKEGYSRAGLVTGPLRGTPAGFIARQAIRTRAFACPSAALPWMDVPLVSL